MKLTQVKVPEIAIDSMMAYAGLQFDHPQPAHGADTVHIGGAPPDVIPGAVMSGVHLAAGITAAGMACAHQWPSYATAQPEKAKKEAVQGLWETVKAGGFAMQIAPSLGLLGAGLVAGGILGDVCSGWAGESIKDLQQHREAAKNRGPQGCSGPED